MYTVQLLVLLAVTIAQEDGPPVIKEHPSNVVARRNDPVTLNCTASGATSIRWFRDGKEVITSTQDPRSHRLLLPAGSLFFLRVTSTRNDSDTGTYWCVASNNYGATRSQNATLTVAMLAYEFQSQAEPLVKARIGDSVSLHCQPPAGTPSPEVTWLKDGRQMSNSSRISITQILVINQAIQEDSSTYTCRARNAAGTRESSPTQLIVMTPPRFEERPANVTSPSGVLVELKCRAQATPAPTVTWRRLDGKMPLGRVRIEEQHQRLVLEHVTVDESGIYVCEVENEAGIAIAQATVKIVDAPELADSLQNFQVMVGEEVTISCNVKGEPQPLVLWHLTTLDRTALLTLGQTKGHSSVSDDGRFLMLRNSAKEDSGTYYCWGVNSGGGVKGQAEVTVVSALPPPVMGIKPKDLTAASGDIASFPCEVVSEAAEATISWWYSPSVHLLPRQLSKDSVDPRISLPDNGALILKNVNLDDAGIYTCRATAVTGTVEQAAVLRVERYGKASEPLLLPAPPTKPRIIATNQTSVQLSWLPNSQASVESGQWYTVEYWRPGWDEWRVADAAMMPESCIISHLTPGHTYTFLVRAVNSKGASFPSPWSDPVTTNLPRDPNLTVEQVRQARRRLSRPIVTLINATITAPESVLLNYEFLTTADESVEGVLVYTVAKVGTVQVATVLGTSSTSHLLHHLHPNTPYTFFIVPFWHSIEGTPSNSHSLTTPEDVPASAPSEVHVTVHEEGSALIRWSSVSVDETRGNLQGYQVVISYNGSQTTETVVSPWLEARGLLPGRLYTVRVAALTGAGLGPFSDPFLLDVGHGDTHNIQRVNTVLDNGDSVMYAPLQPVWLLYLLIPLVLLVFLVTLLYVKRLHQKSPSSSPPNTATLYQDPSCYPDHHSVNMYSEQELVNEYAEPRVQGLNDAVEPYAITALLAPPSLCDSWQHHSSESVMQVNWAAFLPPPPTCPPPLDLGDTAGGSDHQETHMAASGSQYDNMSRSEQYERPCDATSDITYDVYSHVTPADCRNGFLAFNTLQDCSCQKVRADCHPSPLTDAPHSNTH